MKPKSFQDSIAESSFEAFLWEQFNPAEVLEDWAQKMTEQVVALAALMDCDPDVVASYLPLSPVVLSYVENANRDFRVPLSERSPLDVCTELYEGLPLSHAGCVEVAARIQSCLLPAE